MAWLPVTFETRNVVEDGVEKELTGFDAIRVKRQAQAGIAGEITEAQLKAAAETAVRVLREYEKEYMYQLPTDCLLYTSYFGLSGAVPSAERLRGGTGSQCDENV